MRISFCCHRRESMGRIIKMSICWVLMLVVWNADVGFSTLFFFFLLLLRSWAVFSFGCLALVCWLPCLAFSFGFWNLWPSMWYLLSASLGLSERKTSCIPLITSSIVRFAVANTWPLFCSSLQSWHVGIQCCCFTICNGCFLLLPPQLSHYLWGLF